MRLQFYAEDLIRTGGKESLGRLMAFIGDLMSSFGFDEIMNLPQLIEGRISPILEKELGPIIERRFSALDQRKIEAAAKELEKKLLPKLEEYQAIAEEIGLVIERVMLEQSLVSAVTALEVYLHDVTIEVVAKNRFLSKRFSKTLQERLTYQDVANAGGDLGLALGMVAADSYDFYSPESIAKHLTTLLGEKAPLREPNDRAELARILAFRHLIVHRAGLVDRQFKRRTGYRGNLNEPVAIKREFVERALHCVQTVGAATQTGLEALRARN